MKLSAEELNAETLFPGDTIEYYSMMFVYGDERGYRVAKVLQVLKDESEYPLRLDSQELLPTTSMIRRKLDRHGDAIDHAIAKWRKVRTFKLVTGEVQGPTRADRLNAGLKQSIASAYKAVSAGLKERATGKRPRAHKADGSGAKPTTEKQPKPKLASDRFQQQQLSFVKRDAAAPSRTLVAPAPKTPSDTQRKLKRSSLDSMSSRTPASLPLRRRSEQSPERTLKHKTARHHAAQTLAAKPKAASSKYFGEQRGKSPKKTALLSFVAQLEEKKSAQSTTLDEYLALEQKQKDAVERLAPPTDARSRSPAAARARKWSQARAQFRAKHAPPQRRLDQWLSKPSAAPVPATLDESSTPPRLKLKHKASPRRSSLSFVSPARDEQQQRKRKRSSDFSSPAKRLKQDGARRLRDDGDDLMNQWVCKKR